MTALLPIPTDPTRRQLRDATQTLMVLEGAGVVGAKEQRHAVQALTRQLFPRVTRTGSPTRKGRRKRRTLIEPQDATVRCTRCATRPGELLLGGGGRRVQISLGTLDRGDWLPPGHEGPVRAGRIPCPKCDGTGVQPGIGEHDPRDTHYAGAIIKQHHDMLGSEHPLRGDFALRDGDSGPCRTPGTPHQRGFVGGRLIDSLWCGQDAAITISAVRESRAISRMSGDDAMDRPAKGRRLLGPKREPGVVKPGNRRSLMCDRVAVYQAEHNRRVRRDTGFYKRTPDDEALDATLRLCGIDPKAWRKAMKQNPPKAEVDTSGIAEARRRGDLPIEDDLPCWEAEDAITLADGRVVVIDGRLATTAMVFRISTGRVERVARPVRVLEEDGTVDMLHPADCAHSIA